MEASRSARIAKLGSVSYLGCFVSITFLKGGLLVHGAWYTTVT